MSKAGEWARQYERAQSEVRQVVCQRPNNWCLHLNATTRMDLVVENDGRPRIILPDAKNGYLVETDKLVSLARWILDTFAEPDQ